MLNDVRFWGKSGHQSDLQPVAQITFRQGLKVKPPIREESTVCGYLVLRPMGP